VTIEKLRKRTTAGAATFQVKMKAHRGEPANEEDDIQADKAFKHRCSHEWQTGQIEQSYTARASPKRRYGEL